MLRNFEQVALQTTGNVEPDHSGPVFDAVLKVEKWIKTANPEAIFVSSGSIKEAPWGWLPTEFTDPDVRGNRQWGLLRGHAAAELKTRFPKAKLVTLSRSTNEPPGVSDAQAITATAQRWANDGDANVKLTATLALKKLG